jgi:hypothetical protein
MDYLHEKYGGYAPSCLQKVKLPTQMQTFIQALSYYLSVTMAHASTVEPLSISPLCSGFTQISFFFFFLVPMKCPYKQHTTVSDGMSPRVSFYIITCSELLVLK